MWIEETQDPIDARCRKNFRMIRGQDILCLEDRKEEQRQYLWQSRFLQTNARPAWRCNKTTTLDRYLSISGTFLQVPEITYNEANAIASLETRSALSSACKEPLTVGRSRRKQPAGKIKVDRIYQTLIPNILECTISSWKKAIRPKWPPQPSMYMDSSRISR
jgi:hypothetical protein